MPQNASACASVPLRANSGSPSPPGPASTQHVLFIEEQVARCLPILHRQRRQCALFPVKPHHLRKIDRADHIHVVHDETARYLRTSVLKKKPRGLLQSAARIQQLFLVRNLNPHAEVAVGLRYSRIISP